MQIVFDHLCWGVMYWSSANALLDQLAMLWIPESSMYGPALRAVGGAEEEEKKEEEEA